MIINKLFHFDIVLEMVAYFLSYIGNSKSNSISFLFEVSFKKEVQCINWFTIKWINENDDVYLDHLELLELGKWSCPSKCHESDSTNLLLFYSLCICSKEQIKTSRIANAFKL